MELKQIVAWFIIAFMAFSVLAFVFLGNDKTANPNSSTQSTPNTNTSQLTYTAQVDANVVEIFSSFKLIAEAKDFDKAKIDSELKQVDGLLSVNSNFNQTANNGAVAYYYVADVSFDATKTDFSKISSLIQEKTTGFLSNAEFLKNAFVVVPKKIVLANSDLNLSKDYELNDNVIQAFLSPETIKGDSLTVQIRVTFSGEQQIGISSLEIQNNSSQFKRATALLSPKLFSLEQKIVLSADSNYSNFVDKNYFEQEIKKLADVNAGSVDLSMSTPLKQLLLSISNQLDNNSLEKDLNDGISKVAGVTATEFSVGDRDLNAIISFADDANILQLKSSIAVLLSSKNIKDSDFSFTEPAITLSGEIGLTTSNAVAAASALSKMFFDKKFSSKVYQAGLLDLNSITDNDSGKTFAIDSNTVDVLLFPGHKIGDTIFATIIYYYQRNKIVNIAAREEINSATVS